MLGSRVLQASWAFVVLVAIVVDRAGAQQPALDSLRRHYQLAIATLPPPAVLTPARTSPGSSAGSPSGFGASFGDFFAGGGYQARTRYTTIDDGSLVAGLGLGDARRFVGLEIAVTSVSTFRQGFFSNGTGSVKLHRMLPRQLGIAVGYENAFRWGGPDGGNSVYGVASKVLTLRNRPESLFGSVALNVGAGNGRFRREKDFRANREAINPFGAVGIRLHGAVAAIADWTGQDLIAGLSIVPFRRIPLVITPAVADLTHSAGDGARFTLGMGMGVHVSELLLPPR